MGRRNGRCSNGSYVLTLNSTQGLIGLTLAAMRQDDDQGGRDRYSRRDDYLSTRRKFCCLEALF